MSPQDSNGPGEEAGLPPASGTSAKTILVIDVGGTHVKLFASDQRTRLKFDSGPDMTPDLMMTQVRALTAGWHYDVVTIGLPTPVKHGSAASEPHNLAPGWVGFDFEKAFGRPVRILNDAAMQALGDYRGGSMLFLGLGTGLGAALIVDDVLMPLELAHLPYRKGRTYEDYIGLRGLARLHRKRWRRHVDNIVALFSTALQVDDVVLGGGNARLLKVPPPGARLADNSNAFLGGIRVWNGCGGEATPTRR